MVMKNKQCVREQIMAIEPDFAGAQEVHYGSFYRARERAADIAEARERELLAEHEKWKADFNLVYKLLENDIIELNSKHEALIAELRSTPTSCDGDDENDRFLRVGEIESILAKYEKGGA